MLSLQPRSPLVLLILVGLSACEPALAAEVDPVAEGWALGEDPSCDRFDEHAFVHDRVLEPRAWSQVEAASAEAGLVFETPSGTHAALDLALDRQASSLHAELWIDGHHVRTASADGGVYRFDPLYGDGPDQGLDAAALLLLSHRLAAADCVDCCVAVRRLAAPLAAAVAVAPRLALEVCR